MNEGLVTFIVVDLEEYISVGEKLTILGFKSKAYYG